MVDIIMPYTMAAVFERKTKGLVDGLKVFLSTSSSPFPGNNCTLYEVMEG